MILLALDEQGDFEYMEPDKKAPIFIGGILFYDGDVEGEKEWELERIAAYYKAVCKEYSTDEIILEYPTTLHVSKRCSKVQAKFTKIGVSETIKEFLEYGTFKGHALMNGTNELPQRKGVYYPFAYLKSDAEKIAFSGNGAFLNDREASNLYYHMVHDVLERFVFQNGIKRAKNEFALELATRSTPPFPYHDKRKQMYVNAGYPILEEEDKGVFYVKLTNKDVYRTTLSELILANPMQDTDFDLRVESISYKSKSGAKSQGFLYLADSICSILGYGRTGENADEWLLQMDSVASKEIASENNYFLYGYDIVDEDYKRAYSAIEKDNYYEALTEIYNFKVREGEFAKYYRKKWMPYLLEMIQNKMTPVFFEKAVSDFARTLKTNTYNQNIGLFVVEELLKIVEKMKEKQNTAEYEKTFFMLYSAAVSAYSHSGEPRKAKEAYDQAMSYSRYVSVEEFLGLRNKMVVFLTDCFETKEAIKIAEDNLAYQTRMEELRDTITELYSAENFTEKSKTYSQLGQAYAFMKDDRAINCFNEALRAFNKHSANYYITASYLLHYYLEKGMKTEYEKMAEEYFGGNLLPEEQFDYIISEAKKDDPLINYKFALFVFAKSLWIFYKDAISESLWEKIENLPETLRKNNIDKYNGHPTQIIAKYMLLLLLYHNKEKEQTIYRKCLDDPNYAGDDSLLHCISQYLQIEVAIYEGKKDEMSESIKKLAEKMYECFDVFTQEQLEEEYETLWNILSEKFTYMYS